MLAGEREDKQHRAHGHVIENAFAEDGGTEHGEHALVTLRPGIGRGDSIGIDQIRDPRQQNRQHEDDHGEGAPGIIHGRFTEGFHAVANGLDAGQRGAATGENFEEQPKSHHFRGGRGVRQRRDWRRMTARGQNFYGAHDDGDQERSYKEIVGIAKARPASRSPRRFMMVTMTRIQRHSETVWGRSDGTAETSAPTPAEIPTAAVRM